jgi:hypothetical protein
MIWVSIEKVVYLLLYLVESDFCFVLVPATTGKFINPQLVPAVFLREEPLSK